MSTILSDLDQAMRRVPAGRWGVAVSGGADSVALLRLATRQPRIELHVIHLDHETRDGASAHDADFVRQLAERLGAPFHVARRSQIECNRPAVLREVHAKREDRNLPARYRRARLDWFQSVVTRLNLSGVLVAHHADDQAETVAQRLLRGRQPGGLGGMSVDTYVDKLRLLRPLLGISRVALRTYLRHIDQSWIEDASNLSPAQQRNRVRQEINDSPALRTVFLELGEAANTLAQWLDRSTPVLPETFDAGELASLPLPIARHAAARWLRERGLPPEDLSPAVCDRLIAVAADVSGPARAELPGKIIVRRSRARLSAQLIRSKRPQQIGPVGVDSDSGTGTTGPFDFRRKDGSHDSP